MARFSTTAFSTAPGEETTAAGADMTVMKQLAAAKMETSEICMLIEGRCR